MSKLELNNKIPKIIHYFGFSKKSRNFKSICSLNRNISKTYAQQRHLLKSIYKILIFNVVFFVMSISAFAQKNEFPIRSLDRFFTSADTFSSARFYTLGGVGLSTYALASAGLYHSWYKQYPLGKFHFFDDRGEWENMDKVGHIYTSWMQGYLVYSMAEWSGLNKKQSLWTSLIAATLFQSTIETMDGFSEKWGFSIADVGANFLGAGIFAGQELLFDEQIVLLKFSSFPRQYSQESIISENGSETSSLRERARELYGNNLANRTLKDYNAQNYWLSFSANLLIKNERIPKWLNLAVGYSAENVFGGYVNVWSDGQSTYRLNEDGFKRYHQLFLSPDIDFTKIKTDSPFLKTLFRFLNILKFPAPALEFNDSDGIKTVWYWIYY